MHSDPPKTPIFTIHDFRGWGRVGSGGGCTHRRGIIFRFVVLKVVVS